MNNWGITEKEAEQLVSEGKLKKVQIKNYRKEPYTVYYAENPEGYDYKKICDVNNMGGFVLGEWMEFYRCRVDNLATQCNIVNAIPVITKEECINYGL